MSDSGSFIKNIVNHYESEKREAIAKLKQGMAGQGALNLSSLEVIGKYMPKDLDEGEVKIYLLVASLYSIHPSHSEVKSYGRSLKMLRDSLSSGTDSLDERFTRLLNSELEDLQFQFRQFGTMLSAAEIPVDYAQMLSDLMDWAHPSRRTQIKWARDYFAEVIQAESSASRQ